MTRRSASGSSAGRAPPGRSGDSRRPTTTGLALGAPVDVRFEAVARGVREVQRLADAVVDRRRRDAALAEHVVDTTQVLLGVDFDRGVVAADAAARVRRVRPDGLQADVVVVVPRDRNANWPPVSASSRSKTSS